MMLNIVMWYDIHSAQDCALLNVESETLGLGLMIISKESYELIMTT